MCSFDRLRVRFAEGGGFIRLFLDEGAPMARLLSVAAARGMMPAYAGRLLTAFAAEKQVRESVLAESASSLSRCSPSR